VLATVIIIRQMARLPVVHF